MISELSDCRSKDIGEGTNIWQFCVIEELSKIGKNCNICAGCYVESGAVIGNDVTVKCGVQVWRGVEIEDGVFVGPNVTFTNDIFPRSKKHKKEVKTLVKKGASIGANSTILAGVTIGENAMIGAGSVITKDVPKNTLWYGTEATQHAIGKNATFKEDAILVQKLLRERERESSTISLFYIQRTSVSYKKSYSVLFVFANRSNAFSKASGIERMQR